MPTATVAPLAEATRKISRKTQLGAALSSKQWESVPVQVREAAQFSAHVESERLLAVIQDKLEKSIGMVAEKVRAGDALVDRDSFIADVQATAQSLGIETTGGQYKGTIRDIQSVPRLNLIFEMQRQRAFGYARRKIGMDPDAIDEAPAYRFERVEDRDQPREDWEERWQAAAESVGYEGVARGEMVALKTSPIWAALSRFGTPWPPFDYMSGWGVTDVWREDAVAMGLIEQGDDVEPAEDAPFTDGMEASVAGLDPEAVRRVLAAFKGKLDQEGDALKWTA